MPATHRHAFTCVAISVQKPVKKNDKGAAAGSQMAYAKGKRAECDPHIKPSPEVFANKFKSALKYKIQTLSSP